VPQRHVHIALEKWRDAERRMAAAVYGSVAWKQAHEDALYWHREYLAATTSERQRNGEQTTSDGGDESADKPT
jgi:hypothetical protein